MHVLRTGFSAFTFYFLQTSHPAAVIFSNEETNSVQIPQENLVHIVIVKFKTLIV